MVASLLETRIRLRLPSAMSSIYHKPDNHRTVIVPVEWIGTSNDQYDLYVAVCLTLEVSFHTELRMSVTHDSAMIQRS